MVTESSILRTSGVFADPDTCTDTVLHLAAANGLSVPHIGYI